jgi:hypothetical protein
LLTELFESFDDIDLIQSLHRAIWANSREAGLFADLANRIGAGVNDLVLEEVLAKIRHLQHPFPGVDYAGFVPV